MASAPSPPSSLKANMAAGDPKFDLVKQIGSHEVTIAELNALSSSRTVYQKNGSLFFHTTIQKASASEQK
ncbi:putative prefoldin [Rosa chinensis]|uniref:Putative prefoldin n=1 Tax=Rosa chinensis TaxID=74649 RepID=A0A2P6SD14_ROSCH|nr:putative prefoldin [Rosa chinensis]